MSFSKRIAAFLTPLFLASCTFLPRPAGKPVSAETHPPEEKASELVVLLPGRHSLPNEFERKGFLQLVRDRHPHARIVAPDLHIGYYRKQTAIKRLHEDIVLPARNEGLKQVTLIGISMGGLGAILYDLEHPEIQKTLVLLSPFVGDETVIEDIERQGLSQWQPSGPEPDRFSRRLWKGMRQQWLEGDGPPKIMLGCGKSDRLAATSRLLEKEFLPTGETTWLEGDHDWPTWNALYETGSRH